MRRPGREVDDRLIDDEELVLLERRLDVADDAGVDAAAKSTVSSLVSRFVAYI